MIPAGSLTGTINDEAGHPIADLSVYITRQEKDIKKRKYRSSTRTDSNGNFEIKGLFPCEYEIYVRNNKKDHLIKIVKVGAPDATNVSLKYTKNKEL
jgi:protocatechuate 3,4-dioxygenase beta subunit